MAERLEEIECFAQRLLNPFRGVMHTLRYRSAEAVTLDGVHWDIYVANDELVRDLDNARRVQTSDIRYGSWSVERGLRRGPIYPSDDFRRMEIQGAIAYEALLRVHGELPFPLRDRFELWLLDSGQRPLALLASVVREADMGGDHAIEWRAGNAARECFASAAGAIAGNAAETLARHINGRAGERPAAQWFRREADGSGAGLDGVRLTARLQGRVLEAASFPEFFVTPAADEPARALVRDYIAWQAPWFLLLPLDRDTRHAMEAAAQARAPEVEKQHRLYPDIVDRARINAALVEAAILRHQGAEIPRSDALSPHYIELESPCSGNYN